ncbi:MAG: flagellar brake protein [Burkholderiaceae bacterium]|nr:flagellar brake protein [Burkholderiaceae bacterium]
MNPPDAGRAQQPAGQDLRIEKVGFDELRLQVGTRLQMVLDREGRERAFFTSVVGYAIDEYLIVRIPTHHRIPVELSEGETVRIRLFSGVHLYDFRCRVLQLFPNFYLHLSFPTDIRSTPVRNAPRVRADIAAEVLRANDRIDMARIVDISIHGAGILLDPQAKALADGDRFELRFTLKVGVDDRDHLVAVGAEALAVRPGGPDAGSTPGQVCGARFGPLSDGDSLCLQNFILRQLIEGQENLA